MIPEENIIHTSRRKALSFIKSQMKQYGHLPKFEFYPEFEGRKHKGWHYTYRSPFIHANALYSLMNAGSDIDQDFLDEAAKILYDFRERGDLWRFWDVYEAEFPTYSDVEETAICSFILEKFQYQLRNKPLLYTRIRPDGIIPTWIIADWKIFKIQPLTFFHLKIRDKNVEPIVKHWKWITKDDTDHNVAANMLAYLGVNEKTSNSLKYLLEAWHTVPVEEYHYYDKKIILAYHIARAYREGIFQVEVLKHDILQLIQSELANYVYPENLLAYITLSYLNIENETTLQLKNKIFEGIKDEQYLLPYPFTTEKLRVYFGGGGSLTAVWFIEASQNW